jgi:hypothetical protein
MKRVEHALKRQLSENREAPYPDDFESMWSRMEEAGHTAPVMIVNPEPAAPRRHRNWRKMIIAASLSALLVVGVPVYAAINYNWDKILDGREGVQTALEQNLGQTLGQSVTKDGIKLTLHTAVVDEKRTVILYTLDVDKHTDNEYWGVEGTSLTGEAGNSDPEINSHSYLKWDEENQRYNGYFESDWAPQQETSKAKLSIDSLRLYQPKQLEFPKINLNTTAEQTISLGQDGLRDVKVQVFEQGEKLMLSSAITFDSPEAKEWANPQIVPYKNGKPIKTLPGSSYGTPGKNGEYTAMQYFNRADLADEQIVYKLDYAKVEKSIAEPIRFDLELSKKQMESGTTKVALGVPLEQADKDIIIEDMTVTPAQIRVNLRSKKTDYNFPYLKHSLSVNGKTLEGRQGRYPEGDPGLMPMSFERPAGLTITKDTPILFTAKHKITYHKEDKEPLVLTNISEKKQTLMRETGGYPVKWTYYKQGPDLYVETESEDTRFAGVNQTYIKKGKERIIGWPTAPRFFGSDNNKSIDVYKDFKGTEASIYMFYYATQDRDAVASVQLQPQQAGK